MKGKALHSSQAERLPIIFPKGIELSQILWWGPMLVIIDLNGFPRNDTVKAVASKRKLNELRNRKGNKLFS